MTMTAIRSVADVPNIERDQRKSEFCDGWRPIPAKFGRCDSCNQQFRVGEVILWNVHTKLTFHPSCCADTTVSFRPAPHPRSTRQGTTRQALAVVTQQPGSARFAIH